MSDQTAQSTDAIDHLVCYLLGHKWTYLEGAIPEDRKTFRCDRCRELGFYPSMVGENEVPRRYINTETERSAEVER